jgi:hypothetical protein
MQIRTLLLIKVMQTPDYCSTDPPRLHFETPRLHMSVQRSFMASEAPEFDPNSASLMKTRIRLPKIMEIHADVA